MCPVIMPLLSLHNLMRNTSPGKHMINTVISERYASILVLNAIFRATTLTRRYHSSFCNERVGFAFANVQTGAMNEKSREVRI